ncbi:MAG: MFS transporter, partial [Acidimicrobiales bacterium]
GANVLHSVSPANYAALTGRGFFPHLIATPFSSGLHEAFTFAVIACLIASVVSFSRGKRMTAIPVGTDDTAILEVESAV